FTLTVFGRPEFAGNPYFFTWNTARFHGTSYTGFIIVRMSGVDVSIAGFQCREARLLAHRIGRLEERAQSELWHQDSIVQLYHRYIGGSLVNVLRKGGAAYHRSQHHKSGNDFLLHFFICLI